MTRDIEINVNCQPQYSDRMPSRRYVKGADWSALHNQQVHLVAPTVKDAAQAILDVMRAVTLVHVYDFENGAFFARFKATSNNFQNPAPNDIAIERMPDWMHRVQVTK